MSNKVFFAVNGMLSLTIGGIMYVLFRENSYVAQMFDGIWLVERAREVLSVPFMRFLSCYIPDYLWAYSLCCVLVVIAARDTKNTIWCMVVTMSVGTVWEILQFLNILGNTGDICDIIIYLVAALTVLLIFIKRRKRK